MNPGFFQVPIIPQEAHQRKRLCHTLRPQCHLVILALPSSTILVAAALTIATWSLQPRPPRWQITLATRANTGTHRQAGWSPSRPNPLRSRSLFQRRLFRHRSLLWHPCPTPGTPALTHPVTTLLQSLPWNHCREKIFLGEFSFYDFPLQSLRKFYGSIKVHEYRSRHISV